MMAVQQQLIERWNHWRRRTFNRRIFAAMVTIGGLSLMVKVVGFIKELLVARQFGTSDALDAFLIAFLLLTFSGNVIAGALAPAFVPTYVRARNHDAGSTAQLFFSEVLLISLGVLSAVTVLLAVVGGALLKILGSGFGPDKLLLTRNLFFLLLPALTFI
ncbi:MAG: lipid II flippase MurJ, partial [Acidobacteriota bacterium]